MMNKSMIAGLCATMALLVGAQVFAADTPHPKVYRPQMLPQLYVSPEKAQAACPDDKVVWVNWSARRSHLPDDKYYGHTTTGAYACAEAAAQAGIKPAS
jgi:hypothetical protein